MKIKIFSIFLLFGMLVSACLRVEDTGNDTQGNLSELGDHPSQMDPLDGTAWKLLHYRKTRLSEGITITAIFDKGTISGSSGCNSYSGTYQVKGSEISIGPIATTLMACMDPAEVMEIEGMYQEWLVDARTFDLGEEQLMVFRSDGEALTFIPSP